MITIERQASGGGVGVSRRNFLQTAAGALVIAFNWPSSFAEAEAAVQAAPGRGPLPLDQLDSWLAIDADGGITLFSGKVELGTGVQTALAQIVAEELDAPMARMRVIQGDTARVPDQGATAGSKTIQVGGVAIRRAAAEARQALLALASTRLSVPLPELSITDGIIHPRQDRARGVTFAELIGGRRFERTVTESITVKPPAQYHIVGQSVPRMELPAKVCGPHEYVQNVRLPGMKHGRVIRPAAIHATVVSIDESSIASIPGIVKVVRRGNFVGVVAEREEHAIAAAKQLKIVWAPSSEPLPEMATLESVIRATPADEKVLNEVGDARGALLSSSAAEVGAGANGGVKRLEASYHVPFQSHASTGPSCAVADVRADEAIVWCGTQTAGSLKNAIAVMLGMPADRARIAWTEASGCYGHNGADDVAGDAALLSRESGHPVRVQWMRQDEHGWDPKGPAMIMDVKGAVDASTGKITAWDYAVTTPSHLTRPTPRGGNLLAQWLMGEPFSKSQAGGDRNARHNYVFPNNRVAVRWMERSVLRQSSFRGLGAPANVFAIESFVDELAAAAGVDPVEFRLRHLDDERAIAVIKRVAEIAKWQPRPRGGARSQPSSNNARNARSASDSRASSTSASRGRGIAFLQYENANAYVATIADVAVNRTTGLVRVTNVFVAHDCGLVINPDGVRNQIEGSTLQTISRTLKEEVRWDHEKVTSIDWASYPILTFSEVPETIEIALINRPDQPALGAGEPAVCSVPAAIANAIADATGARLRALPFTPEKVKAALA